MRKSILVLFIAIAGLGLAQAQKNVEKLSEYTASNGVTYKVGDDIRLGKGSSYDRSFVYVRMGGVLLAALGGGYNEKNHILPAGYKDYIVTIKYIKKSNYRRTKGAVYFGVNAGNIVNYTIQIEPA